MVRDVEFLRRNTDRPIKMTVPGPFTMTQQAQNDYYPDDAAAAMAYAAAVNEELRDLQARPAPTSSRSTNRTCRRAPTKRARTRCAAIARALEGIDGITVLHTCFGYAHVVHARLARVSVPRRAGRRRRSTQIAIESMQQQVDLARARVAAAQARRSWA